MSVILEKESAGRTSAETMLRLLKLLQDVHRRPMSARALAKRVNRHPKTVQRDLSALADAGFPIYYHAAIREWSWSPALPLLADLQFLAPLFPN